MAAFESVALVASHSVLPSFLNYLISDLTELCMLAAVVNDHVERVDIPVGPMDRDPLRGFDDYLCRHRPQLVGISTYTCGVSSAVEYARRAKRSGAYVVMGGYHPTAAPDAMLASPHVDAVVRGEGESTLLELVLDGPTADVAGLSLKIDGAVVHGPERPLIDDLDGLPLPLRTARPVRFGLPSYDYHTDSVFTSRGCNGKCTFCANHIMNKRWRARSNQKVLEELISIVPRTRGARKLVKFWDANFLTEPERIEQLCRLIIDEGLHKRFRFSAETRVNDIVRAAEVLPLMREAGFMRLGTGIESPNPETLKAVKKGVSLRSVERATELVLQSKMHFASFYIIGHDNESEQDILRYPEYAIAPGRFGQSAHFFVLTPYPGTPLYDEYDASGRIASRNWDLYTNYGAVIGAGGLTALELQALLATVSIQYSLDKRFERGERFRKILLKILALLLAFTRILLAHRCTQEERETSLWKTLQSLRGGAERPASSRRRRPWSSLALRFHRRGHDPITLALLREPTGERVVHADATPLPRGTLVVNVPTARLFTLARTIDPQRDGHDVITLMLRPRAVRLPWALSLVGQAARVAATVARIGFDQLRYR